jgi:hypothetical protein
MLLAKAGAATYSGRRVTPNRAASSIYKSCYNVGELAARFVGLRICGA